MYEKKLNRIAGRVSIVKNSSSVDTSASARNGANLPLAQRDRTEIHGRREPLPVLNRLNLLVERAEVPDSLDVGEEVNLPDPDIRQLHRRRYATRTRDTARSTAGHGRNHVSNRTSEASEQCAPEGHVAQAAVACIAGERRVARDDAPAAARSARTADSATTALRTA